MINETYQLWTKEKYTFPLMGKFIPNVVAYIHDEDDSKRPVKIVVPGGGYYVVSHSEGDLVLKSFIEKAIMHSSALTQPIF